MTKGESEHVGYSIRQCLAFGTARLPSWDRAVLALGATFTEKRLELESVPLRRTKSLKGDSA